MDPARPLALQEPLAQGQRQGDALFFGLGGGEHVLQPHERGLAGPVHQGEERLEVPLFQGLGLLLCQAVVVEEVHGPQHRSVSRGGSGFGQIAVEVLLLHVPEELFPEDPGHRFHLRGDGGVVPGEVGVVAAGVHHAQGVAVAGQVELHLLHHRGGRVFKVHGGDAPHRAGHLVQQAGGLAEVHVLRVLGDDGGGDGVNLPVVVQVAEHRDHQHLKGGGAGKAGALQHPGDGVAVKAPHLVAQLHALGADAPDQGLGAGILLVDLKLGYIHRVQLVVLRGL